MRLQSSLFVAVLLCRPSALSWPFSWRLKQRKLIKHSVYLVNGFSHSFFWSSFITNVLTEWYSVNCPTLCTLTSLTSVLCFSDGCNACWIVLSSRAQAMQWNSFTLSPGRKYNQFAASSDTCGSGLLSKRQESSNPSANADLSLRPIGLNRLDKEKARCEIVGIMLWVFLFVWLVFFNLTICKLFKLL